MKIFFIDIEKLKPHEKISEKRLAKLNYQLTRERYLKKPLIVENKNYIILDGHHRFHILKNMGLKKVPCYLVDYNKITVVARRKRFKYVDLKKLVYQKVEKGELLPYKTTKHLVKFESDIKFDMNLNCENAK